MPDSQERLLYVALDHNDRHNNFTLAANLAQESGNFGFKINQDHWTLWPGFAADVIGFGRPVFVDTKINNGRRTMSNIVEEIGKKGASLTNVWALAERMMKPLPEIAHKTGMELFAVTVTTHFDEDFCQRVYRRNLGETVRMFTEIALEQGCDGVILPGTTLDAVADKAIKKLVPAVRPDWFEDKKANDQEQPVTPTAAIQEGADILVCGSPIYRHPRPAEALQMILEEIKAA